MKAIESAYYCETGIYMVVGTKIIIGNCQRIHYYFCYIEQWLDGVMEFTL